MAKHGKLLVVAAQKDVSIEDPKSEDVYKMGVLVEVVQYLKMPDGRSRCSCRATPAPPS